MSWNDFLDSIAREYKLPEALREVLLCLSEEQIFSEQDILSSFRGYHNTHIEPNTLKGRTRRLIERLSIERGVGQLQRLRIFLAEKHQEYQNKDSLFSEIGLQKIHANFPDNLFSKQLEKIVISEDFSEKKVDILQTFAPNLAKYQRELVDCLNNEVSIRILLAWPYSQAARLRETVLISYTDQSSEHININNKVLENLETIEAVLEEVGATELLQVRLYDTLPSISMYRAGNYLLAGLFLHGVLAVDSFQLELDLQSPNELIAETLRKNFELLWKSSRELLPIPGREHLWRNDLRILFLNNKYDWKTEQHRD